MKKICLLMFAICIGLSAHAQNQPTPVSLDDYRCIDTASLVIRYSFKFKYHSGQQQYNEDIRVVQIGRNVVKDYSQIVYHYDSLATENFRKGLPADNNLHATYPCEIYNYTKEKRVYEKYRMILNAGTLCYPSDWRDIPWELSSESPVRILGYTCNKARANYAGREYTAWYTLDIPASYGPYKFHGLPGLILKIEENNGMYIWEAFSIRQSPVPINLYTYEKEVKCSRQEADKTIGRMMRKPTTFLVSTGAKIMVRRADGSWGAPTEEKENKYEPIELE